MEEEKNLKFLVMYPVLIGISALGFYVCISWPTCEFPSLPDHITPHHSLNLSSGFWSLHWLSFLH